ncbi:autotransporter-associated beta strand repeat-containing protein, partial [Pelagibacteraceae bacterium]|nr:autotransporter-associated beta strand repeat-containing protein [Pelagibacteraceae bacterium]
SNSGSIQANKIKIDTGSKGGTEISGTLNSDNNEEKGGNIEITGKDIDVNSATISADGKTGGGKVLIGGDWQGTGDLLQATYLNIDSNSKITANALSSGAGGTIVAWSDIKNANSFTKVSGTLEAKGIDGSGGQIETSGADLNINGIKIDTSSVTGSYGNWLVDPTNLTIDSSAAATYATNLSSTDVTLTADNTITLNNNISYSGSRNSTLTFDATTTVLNANITSSNGTLSIDINTILEIGATNTTFTTNGGNVDISGVIRAVTGENSNNFTINAGTGNVTFSSNVVKQVGDYSAGFAQGNFTSISDLDFSGTFLNAINIAGTATTIGDVTFQDGRASNNTSNANESFQHEIQNWNSRNYGNTGLNNIMKGIRWSGGTGHSPYVQFTNATAGQKYKIQALFKEQNYNRYFDVYVDGTKIVDDFRPLDAGSTSVNRGRYLTYQFEAASTNVMFRLSGRTAENSGGRLHGNDVNPILNAISIEAVDAGAAINNLSITANQFSAQAIEVGGDLTVTNSGGSTISGVISGSTALVKAGTGSLALTGSNTYTGNTTISAGTLDIQERMGITYADYRDSVAAASGYAGNHYAYDYQGDIVNNGVLKFSDTTYNAWTTAEPGANTSQYFTGDISGSGSLVMSGRDLLGLKGNNTYSGGTIINNGSVFSESSVLSRQFVGSGSVTINNGGTLRVDRSNSGAFDNEIVLNGGTFQGSNGFGANWDGNISVTANSTIIATVNNNLNLLGVISGSGGITKSGSGTLTLSGSNSFTSSVNITAGTLSAANNNSLGSTPNLISSSGTFKTTSGVVLPSLTTSGAITLSSGIVTTGAQSYAGNVVVAAGTREAPVEFT